jgi:hypothetical protein
LATAYQTLKGTIKWAQVYEPDVFSGAENWKINFYPANDEEWEKFRKTGLQVTEKTDNEGKNYVTFRRPAKKTIKDEVVFFTPPEITGKVRVGYVNAEGAKVRQYSKAEKDGIKRIDKDGNEIHGEINTRENTELLIGNESLVLVNYSYYDTAKGKGHRLENINVLEHILFVPGAPPTSDDTPVKENKKSTFSTDLDDKIPF